MSKLFYCTKIDKNGNKLTSSYTSKKGADKYGAGCDIVEKIYRADFSDPSQMHLREGDFKGPLVRGILKNNNPQLGPTVKGRFVIWAKRDSRWFETVFHFPSYSAANTAMKSMISEYEAMALIDNEEDEAETYAPSEISTELETTF